MPDLFRVAPCRAGARTGTPGHPAFVPVGHQGYGRLDNPSLYAVLYLADSSAAAVAEAFRGRHPWNGAMFQGPPAVPGSAYALSRFSCDEAVVDLDDPSELIARMLRPSRIVTPDRTETQRWANALYAEGAWAGARWWSSLDSRWGVFGVWAQDALRLRGAPSPLDMNHPAVRQAAATLDRVLV